MANHVSLKDIKARAEFVEKAAARFQENPAIATFGDMEPGGYLAIRWGMDSDCVLVFKLDPDFEPELFGQVIENCLFCTPTDSRNLLSNLRKRCNELRIQWLEI